MSKEPGLYSTDFAHAFSELLEKAGTTCYKISQYSHVDEAYLSRLRNGEKGNPSPEILVRILLGLVHHSNKIDINDAERLFNSVGRSIHVQA